MSYDSNFQAAIDRDDKNAVFNYVYTNDEMVKHTIPFNPEWNNGTGYFDFAVDADLPGVEIGEIARTRAPMPNNRRLLLVKTTYGNVVLFERYTPNTSDILSGPIILHAPDEVVESEMIGAVGQMTMANIINALGDNSLHDNVGLRLWRFIETVKRGMTKKTERKRRFMAEADIARAADA